MQNPHHHTEINPGKGKSTLIVKEPSELLPFLIKELSDKSRNSVKSLLVHGQISIQNKTITQYNHALEPGEKVIINWNKKNEQVGSHHLKILFEDAFIIVIEKQAGLLSVPDDAKKEETAQSILTEHVRKERPSNKIFPVHRLDKATSGVMMFAKKIDIQHKIRDNWTQFVTERTYIAVAEGIVKKDQDTIVSWLKENKEQVVYSSRRPDDGKKAITHYKVLKRSKDYTLLEVELETGRKNQIRVHMGEIGNIIAGDVRYGAKSNPLKRLGLHAHILGFTHPVTGKKMRFESDIPRSFINLFKKA